MRPEKQAPDVGPIAILASLDRPKLEAARVALSAEIAVFLRKKRSSLKALDMLLRAAMFRDGVEPDKKPRRTKKAPPATDLAGLIVRYLTDIGPTKPALIAAAIAKSTTMVAETLKNNRATFFQVPNGWGLVGVHDRGKE